MISVIRLWVFLSAGLVAAGWILSAVHALNRAGYAVSFLIMAVALVAWHRLSRPQPLAFPGAWAKIKHRFRRPAPLLFLAIFLLNLLGGVIASPDDWDTRAYRLPRILHWLGQGGWHWIHTADSRMNIAGCVFEWIAAPLVLFLRTDRWMFLVNNLPYLLLPGMLFFVFRRLHVARHTAWWWMWLLPAGSCFMFQACSNSNDTLGAIFVLAAIVFALRAGETGRVSDLLLSLLAAGLMTGTKQTSLPLLLPWGLVALPPAVRLLRHHPAQTIAAAAAGLLVSVLPMALLNEHYVGTWSGFPTAASNQTLLWGNRQELVSPFWGLMGNLFCFPVQNLLPPFFPWADAWNRAMHHFLESGWGVHFRQFESFGQLSRSTGAGNTGLGLAMVGLTVISICAARHWRRAQPSALPTPWLLRLLYWAPWVALGVFLAKVGTYQNARQAAPYYPLLFPVLLAAPGMARLVRRRWWQCLSVAVLLFTLANLAFVRMRSTVPPALVASLRANHPHSKFVSIFGDFYTSQLSVRTQRNFIAAGPAAAEPVIGYATTVGGAEPGWWLPFGRRQVIRVLPGDGLADLHRQHIQYVAVEELALSNQTPDQWAAQYGGKVVDSVSFQRDPGGPLAGLYLVRVGEAPSPATSNP
jgi:hypothetical protein